MGPKMKDNCSKCGKAIGTTSKGHVVICVIGGKPYCYECWNEVSKYDD